MRLPRSFLLLVFLSAPILAAVARAARAAETGQAPSYHLAGRALLKAGTLREGPTCGRRVGSENGVTTPFVDQQPVQGFSDLALDPQGGFWVLSDNGFGTRENSADYVLALYHVRPDFKKGTISVEEIIELSDPHHHAGFALIADGETNPGTDNPVDPRIRTRRLLTGADFDPEGLAIMGDRTFWVGDEFGPFLLHLNAAGELLSAPVPTPGVMAPENPFLKGRAADHPSSGGFEGLDASVDGKLLYGLLEKTAANDPPGTLRLYRFDPAGQEFVGDPPFQYYPLQKPHGHAIGALAAIGPETVAVVERDKKEGSAAQFKRIYLVHLDQATHGVLHKSELADLLRIPDPLEIGAQVEGSRTPGTFALPFITLEGITLVDEHTLAVCNDNNFPFSVGRHEKEGLPDDNEIVLLDFDRSLALKP